MTTALMILQAFTSLFLIIVVLLQFGKGAEAGLMTAAGSESIMSSSTRGNIMVKITAFLAIVFLGNSILLARLEDTKFQKSILDSEKPVARQLNSDAEQKAAAEKAAAAKATKTAPTSSATAPTAPATPAAAPVTTPTPTTTK